MSVLGCPVRHWSETLRETATIVDRRRAEEARRQGRKSRKRRKGKRTTADIKSGDFHLRRGEWFLHTVDLFLSGTFGVWISPWWHWCSLWHWILPQASTSPSSWSGQAFVSWTSVGTKKVPMRVPLLGCVRRWGMIVITSLRVEGKRRFWNSDSDSMPGSSDSAAWHSMPVHCAGSLECLWECLPKKCRWCLCDKIEHVSWLQVDQVSHTLSHIFILPKCLLIGWFNRVWTMLCLSRAFLVEAYTFFSSSLWFPLALWTWSQPWCWRYLDETSDCRLLMDH